MYKGLYVSSRLIIMKVFCEALFLCFSKRITIKTKNAKPKPCVLYMNCLSFLEAGEAYAQ